MLTAGQDRPASRPPVAHQRTAQRCRTGQGRQRTRALLTWRRLVRVVAASYPLLVTVVVVVTGNHYVLDALAGAAAVCVTAFLCLRLQPSHGVGDTGSRATRRSTKEDCALPGQALRPKSVWAGAGPLGPGGNAGR